MRFRNSLLFEIVTIAVLFSFFFTSTGFNIVGLAYAEDSQPKLAILDISEIDISEANKTRIYSSVEGAVSDTSKFNIVASSNIAAFQTDDEKREEANQKNRIEKIKEAQLALQKGKTYYDNAAFDQASVTIKGAISTFEDNFDVLVDSRPLLSAYLFLAMSYYSLNQIVEGKLCFDRLLKLDPNVELDSSHVPPKISKAFHDYKKGVEDSARAKIIVLGDDKAKLFFNGKFIDDFLADKPITLEKIYPGKHNILITKKGYTNQFKSFVVTDGTISISVKLKSISSGRFSENIKKASRESAKKFLCDLGQSSKILADVILIYSLAETMGEYFLEGQYFDTRSETFSKVVRISLGKDLKFPEDGAEKMIGELSNYLDDNNSVLEKSIAEIKKEESSKVKEASEEKPPLIQEFTPPPQDNAKKDRIRKEFEDENFESKKALAWIIIGVLVLGGATAGVVYYLTNQETGGAIEFYPP